MAKIGDRQVRDVAAERLAKLKAAPKKGALLNAIQEGMSPSAQAIRDRQAYEKIPEEGFVRGVKR